MKRPTSGSPAAVSASYTVRPSGTDPFRPTPLVRLPCGSMSTISTFRSARATDAAKLIAVVVFPTPPFWFVTAKIFFTRGFGRKPEIRSLNIIPLGRLMNARATPQKSTPIVGAASNRRHPWSSAPPRFRKGPWSVRAPQGSGSPGDPAPNPLTRCGCRRPPLQTGLVCAWTEGRSSSPRTVSTPGLVCAWTEVLTRARAGGVGGCNRSARAPSRESVGRPVLTRRVHQVPRGPTGSTPAPRSLGIGAAPMLPSRTSRIPGGAASAPSRPPFRQRRPPPIVPGKA